MDLDTRMKWYEHTYRDRVPARMPVVIRLDGKCFHSLTRKCVRPFDEKLWEAMTDAVLVLMNEVPARLAYQQSDEVSLLLVDYNRFDTEQWFRGVIQKMASVSASIMGVHFSLNWGLPGYFDSRVMAIPERDIENYFVWRQRDCMRNAASMAAQDKFSTKELHGKNGDEMKMMLENAGVRFDDYPEYFRFGTVIEKNLREAAPIFSKNWDFLKRYLSVEQE